MSTERLTPLPPRLADGQVGFCLIADAPLPTMADMYGARTSPSARRRVDVAYAAACGIEDDALEPFLERLALYDLRMRARDETEARREIAHERLRRDLYEWSLREAPRVS